MEMRKRCGRPAICVRLREYGDFYALPVFRNEPIDPMTFGLPVGAKEVVSADKRACQSVAQEIAVAVRPVFPIYQSIMYGVQ